MRLTDMDNEPVFIDPCMIESIRRVGHLTEIVTRMNDRLVVLESLDDILTVVCKESERYE